MMEILEAEIMSIFNFIQKIPDMVDIKSDQQTLLWWSFFSLFALKQSQSPIAVVVVNNRGGGIFKKLPIRAFPELSPYLTTPHQFSFEKVAAAAELAYACCDDEAKLAEALETFKTDRKPIVIECAMDDEIDNTVQQTLHRITLT